MYIDLKDNQAVLNGIRHLTKESAKRTRKMSTAIWIDVDQAKGMVRVQFEDFFMRHAKAMMDETWKIIQEIKKEETT